MRVIGLSGKKQVGKSTAMEILTSELENRGFVVLHRSFATPIKELVSQITNHTMFALEQEEVKSKEVTPLKTYWVIQSDGTKLGPFYNSYDRTIALQEDILRDPDGNQDILTTKPTVRELLQQIGTNVVRDIHPNIWIEILRKSISYYAISQKVVVIISDVRFNNELEVIVNEFNGDVLRITRDLSHQDNHESETALNEVPFSNTIHNDSTLSEFKDKLIKALSDLQFNNIKDK